MKTVFKRTSAGKGPIILGILPLFILLLLLGACGNSRNNNGKDSSGAVTAHGHLVTPGQKQCYNYMVNGDTVILTLLWLDESKFTGSMVYRLREKDGNIGTLQGQLRDSILLADYQFNSEGVTSTREVAFKQIADYIVEGYGEVISDSSGFKFKDPANLKFDLNRKLQKVNCQ